MSGNIRKKLFDFLKSKDRYGHPITLKYQNDSVYKSAIGGVFTLISYGLLLMYFIYLSVGTFQRTQFTVFNSLYKRDLRADNSSLELTIDNFDIALDLKYDGDNSTISDNIELYFSSYFMMTDYRELTKAEQVTLGINYYWNVTKIKSEYCEVGRLGGMITDSKLIQSYVCLPGDFKYNFIGSYSTDTLKYLQIQVDYCNQDYLDEKYPGMKKKCKTKTESNKIINLMYVQVPVMIQYFDEKDFSANPIKNLVSYDIYAQLNPNLSTKSLYKISENKVNLKDSWLSSMIDNKELSYVDMKFGMVYQSQPDEQEPLLAIKFILDENVITKDRTVSTIVDALANAGGMMGIVFAIVSVFIGWIQKSLFNLSIMKEIFYIQEDTNLDITSKRKQTSNQTNAIDRSSISEIPSIEDLENIDPGDNWQDNNVDKVIKYIRSLKPFAFAIKDLLIQKLRKIFARSEQKRFKDTLYEEGLTKLEQQFDIVKVMQTLRKIDLIAQITLTKYQLKLLPYMKNNVLGHEKTTIIKRKGKDRLYSSIKQLVSQTESSKVDKRMLKNLQVISQSYHSMKNLGKYAKSNHVHPAFDDEDQIRISRNSQSQFDNTKSNL